MRKLALTLFTVVVSLSQLKAQSYSYTVLENNPEKAYTKFLAPEFGSEYSGINVSILVGANARMGISDKLVFEGDAQLDIYQIHGKGPGYHLEGGVFLPLKTKTKIKDVPVILSYNPYAGSKYEDGKRYTIEETKYITIPNMDYKDQYGVRGGIYTRGIGIGNNESEAGAGTLTLVGPYIGVQKTSQAYVKTKINEDVDRIGAGLGRYFIDVILFPVKSISDETLAPTLKKDKAVGWRGGFQWYLDPHDGEYKRLMNSIFTAEIGSRPYTGFYMNFTWGFAFMNQR
jgi:hypothetical protein